MVRDKDLAGFIASQLPLINRFYCNLQPTTPGADDRGRRQRAPMRGLHLPAAGRPQRALASSWPPESPPRATRSVGFVGNDFDQRQRKNIFFNE